MASSDSLRPTPLGSFKSFAADSLHMKGNHRMLAPNGLVTDDSA